MHSMHVVPCLSCRHRALALILDADPACKDAKDFHGNTPAHLAAMHYHRYSLQVLQVSSAAEHASTAWLADVTHLSHLS